MKAIVIIFFVSILPVGIYASDCNTSCPIADAPAPALTEYFTNLQKATENILDALSEAEDSVENESTRKQERNRVMASLNSILSFENYFSSFDFKISLPITNEVPPEVKRDHDRLEAENEKLSQVLTRAAQRNIDKVAVFDICSGVSNCNLETGKSARWYLGELIKNNNKIAKLYRGSVLDKAFGTKDDMYILVANDFRGQIEQYYNKDTLTLCSACEGGFADRIKEAISNISFKNDTYKEGVQTWKDAWSMLRGGNPGVRQEQEALLLSQYLETQNIAGDQASIVMDNLDRYGSGFSSSNPLFNSHNYMQNNTENTIQSFSETLRQKFAEDDDAKVPVRELNRVDVSIQTSEDIGRSIRTLYEEQLPSAQVQDTNTQAIQASIIKMHFDLVNTINMLSRVRSDSEKVCNKAGPKGRCEY